MFLRHLEDKAVLQTFTVPARPLRRVVRDISFVQAAGDGADPVTPHRCTATNEQRQVYGVPITSRQGDALARVVLRLSAVTRPGYVLGLSTENAQTVKRFVTRRLRR